MARTISGWKNIIFILLEAQKNKFITAFFLIQAVFYKELTGGIRKSLL